MSKEHRTQGNALHVYFWANCESFCSLFRTLHRSEGTGIRVDKCGTDHLAKGRRATGLFRCHQLYGNEAFSAMRWVGGMLSLLLPCTCLSESHFLESKSSPRLVSSLGMHHAMATCLSPSSEHFSPKRAELIFPKLLSSSSFTNAVFLSKPFALTWS